MSDLNQSPKQDELSRGNEPLYHVSMFETGVMCCDPDIKVLMVNCERPDVQRGYLKSKIEQYEDLKWHVPEWMISGVNCQHGEDILPTVIHTYLMRPGE